MFHQGDSVPHFDVRNLDNEPVSYSTMWQRRNLVLVTLADVACDSCTRYISELTALIPALGAQNAECVITRDSVPGMSSSGALVADRWGEIVYIAETPDIADLPSPKELLDWVSYVQTRCPECEGEVK
jgi:hypothetical protein